MTTSKNVFARMTLSALATKHEACLFFFRSTSPSNNSDGCVASCQHSHLPLATCHRQSVFRYCTILQNPSNCFEFCVSACFAKPSHHKTKIGFSNSNKTALSNGYEQFSSDNAGWQSYRIDCFGRRQCPCTQRISQDYSPTSTTRSQPR